MRKDHKAFTLVELLVVISIIALLISILLPSLNKARQQARRAVCMSNMRGLGQSMQLYANDNRDFLPGVGLNHGGSGLEPQGSWFFQMKRYYGNNEAIARCPDDNSDFWETPFLQEPEPIFRRVSYATNYFTVAPVAGKGPYNRTSSIRTPARTVFSVELAEKGDFAVADHVHPENWFAAPAGLAAKEMEIKQHMGKSNFVFFDAHVETLPFDATYGIDYAASKFPNLAWKHNFYDPAVAR